MKNDLYIFLDESGTNEKNKVSIVGALAIPNDIYNLEDFNEMTGKLRSNELKIHFTKFNKKDTEDYTNLLVLLSKYAKYIRLNCILYKMSNYQMHPLYTGYLDHMIYSKLPERAIYGVLRYFGSYSNINVTLYTEYSSQYENNRIASNLKRDLNIHSIYRNKSYKIIKSKLVKKNIEIGVECTDLLIGILRFIILNATEDRDSKTNREKAKFICDSMGYIYQIYENLSMNELNGGYFNNVDVKYYLGLFIGKYLNRKEIDDEK